MHDDPLCRVDRRRETDGLRAGDDRRIDADHLARRVDERASGVAGIQRGIGLDHVVDHAARYGAQRTPERGHDACGHRLGEAERVAHGNRDLPDAQFRRFAELGMRQCLGRADPQHREVGARIVPDEGRFMRGAVRERHSNGSCAVDDVAVRQKIAVRGEKEPRSGSATYALPPSLAGYAAVDGNKDDGLLHALERADDSARVRVEQCIVALALQHAGGDDRRLLTGCTLREVVDKGGTATHDRHS